MKHHSALTLCTLILTIAPSTGCSEDTSADDAGSPSQSPTGTASQTDSAWTGATIPDGAYQHVLTQKSLRQHGITVPIDKEEWAPDGTLTTRIEFHGSQWALLANYYGDPMTPGATGTLSYDEQGRLVQYEPCAGASCGESRYTWKLDGDTLTITPDLTWTRENRPDVDLDSQDARIFQMMCCGTWTKVE